MMMMMIMVMMLMMMVLMMLMCFLPSRPMHAWTPLRSSLSPSFLNFGGRGNALYLLYHFLPGEKDRLSNTQCSLVP